MRNNDNRLEVDNEQKRDVFKNKGAASPDLKDLKRVCWGRFRPNWGLVEMDVETCIGILISWPFFAVPTILAERLCSCYFPYLLSAKIYFPIKNKWLQNILIAHQRTRSVDSKTKREDRNKLPFIGCIFCMVAFPWLLSELIIVLLFLILNIIGSNLIVSPFMNILKNICLFLFTSYHFWVFAASMPLLYLADYSFGLRRWQSRGRQ